MTAREGADVGVMDAWKLTAGTPDVIVAICDAPVKYTHPDLAGAMWVNEAELNGVKGVDDDGNDFIDREYNEKQKTEGVTRQLRAFEVTGKGIARHGYEICDAEGNVIGEVTSGTMGPSVKKAIGMGYVAKAYTAIDSEIFIDVRGRKLKAKVVKAPFRK